MKQFEIKLVNGSSVIIRSKKEALKYIHDFRDLILGVYVIKKDILIMFVTFEDIQKKEELYYL